MRARRGEGRSKRRGGGRSAQLGLRASGDGRGGWRASAGRPRGRSDHYVPHLRRPRVTSREAVHATLKVVAGLPSLRRPRAHARVLGVFAAEKAGKGFRLVHYAVRSGHLHLICEADDTRALSRGVQRVASRLGRKLNVLLGRTGRLFADRFHAVVIATPRQMRNALRYVLLNLHKDELRHTGSAPRGIDPCSSGRWFDGWKCRRGRAPPLPDADAPVTRAESWLLRAGWRRGGLISWDDVPG